MTELPYFDGHRMDGPFTAARIPDTTPFAYGVTDTRTGTWVYVKPFTWAPAHRYESPCQAVAEQYASDLNQEV